MWGRISSMAQIVQEKLEESLGEDPVEDVEATPVASSPAKEDDVDTELRRALRESEKRNEEINREFQKLLRQKEEELAELRGTLRTGPTLDAGEAGAEIQEPHDADNQASSRDNQQFYAGIAARDTMIAALQNKLEQSESRERQLEQQGRDNEEKVMSELAVKIKAAEMFQLKLEESKQLVEDRNKTIEGLMDRLDAQQRLIESRDQVIDQLKAMKNLDSGADELVSTLREQLEAMNNRVEKAVDEGERARREISALKKELEEKNDIIASKDKLEEEKAYLIQQIREMEEEHSAAVQRWQIFVQEKEQALAAEFAETELVYRTTEHDLKEQLDEKTQIIESKDEAIQVLKRAIQEKNFSGEGSSPSPHSDRVVVLLEEKLKEQEHQLNGKSDTISVLEKDIAEKAHIIKSLEKSVQEQAAEKESLQETCQARQRELDEIKEKYETELSEKETRLRSQVEASENLEKTIADLKQSLANVDSKENVTERLLLLDAEKEQQFRDEKQAFDEREKLLHEQLQIALGERSKLSEELASTKAAMEVKEKDMNSRMGKLKIQAKAKLASLQNEKEKLSKEMQEVELHLVQEKEEKLNVQKRVTQVEQEKETAEAKRLELEHALDEFVRSTDRKGMLSGLDRNVPVEHVTESANDQTGEEEMGDSSTVSTIVGSTNEESGFVNVMKILEEERYGMERRLDLITKERNSLQSKVEELEEMLEAEKERQHKKAEEISSDEDAEHAKHIAEESLMTHVETLQEENETLRGALELERSAMANLQEQMKGTTLNEKNVLQAELESLKEVILVEQEKYANLSSDLEQTKEHYEQRMEEVHKLNEELQLTMSRMESVERELQQDIDDQKKLIEEKDKEIGKLQGALMENSSGFELLNASFSETSSQVQQFQEQLKAKETELETLQVLLRGQDTSFQNLKESYTDVCTKANELQAVLANKDDEVKTLLENKDKLTSEVDSLTFKEAESIAEIQNLREVLEQREGEILKLKAMFEEKDSSFEHLNTSFVETSSQVKDLEEIVKAKEAQVGILQRSLEEQTLSFELVSKSSSETESQIKELEETLAARQSEIDALQVRLKHQRLEFEQLNTSCADSTSKVKELENSCETKDAEVRALKVNLEEQCLSYERLVNSHVELEGEVKGLHDSLSAKEHEVATLQSTLQQQGFTSEQLGSRCLTAESEAAKLREEQNLNEQQISTLTGTVAELDLTNQRLRSEINQTSIQLTDLKEAVVEKDSAIRLLETRIEEQGLEQEHLQTSFADASSESRDLRDSLAAKEAELKVLRSSLDDQGSAFTELTSSLSEQSSQLQELNRSLTAKQDENNVLKSNLEDQESRFKLLESEYMAEVSQLQEKVAEREREVEKQESSLLELSSSYDETSSKLKNLHEILAGKDVELDSLKAALEEHTQNYDQLCSSRDEANVRIKEQQDLLLSKQMEVDMLNSTLEKKNLKLDQLNVTHNEMVAKVRKEEELLVLKEAEITKLQTSLEEQGTSYAENTSQVKELQEILRTKDNEIDKLQNSLAERESDFEQLQVRYSDMNSVITELQQTLSEKDTVVSTLQANLQDQSASLENRCGELLAQVNELQLQLSQKAEELLELQTSLDYSNLSVENLDTSLNEASAQVEELKGQIAARDNKFVALKKKAQALKKSHESVCVEHAKLKEELEGLKKEKELFLEEKEAMETCLTQLIELKEQIREKDEALLATKRENENSAASVIDLQEKLDIVLQEKEQLKIERNEIDFKFQQIIEEKLSMEAAMIDSKKEMAFAQSQNATVKEELVELKKLLHSKETEASDLKEVIEHLKGVVEETNNSIQEKMREVEVIKEKELQEKLAVKEKDLLELGEDLSQSRAMLNEVQNKLRQNEERFDTSKLAFERERDEWKSNLHAMAADKSVLEEELIANKEKLEILSAEFDRVEVDLKKAREEVSTKDGMIASLQREIVGLEGVVTEEHVSSQNERALQEQVDSKQTESRELHEKLQHLQELLLVKENDVARLSKEIQESREALAEARSRIEEVSSKEVEFKKAEETNVELQANLSDVAAELRHVSSEKTALESQFVDVEERLAAFEQELVAVRADLELSNLEVNKKDKYINALEQELIEMRLTVDEDTRIKEEQALAMSRKDAEVNEKIQERDRKLQDIMSELESKDCLCDDQRGKLVELNERHEVTEGKLIAAQAKLDEMATYVREVETANALMRHEKENRGADVGEVPAGTRDFSNNNSADKVSLESELLDVNEKLTSLAVEQERTLAELEKAKSELRDRNLREEIPSGDEQVQMQQREVVDGGFPLLGSVADEETRISPKEQELVTQVQHLQMEKEQLEAKLADVVSQVEDLSAARRAIETELGHTRDMFKELTVQHEWTTSELENTKEELQEQENELNKVRRELREDESQRDTIRSFEEKLLQKEQELVQVRNDFEATVAAKIEETTMVKDLEKAQVEEQFAKTVEETRSHKDEVIAKLKAKIREKIDLNKKITADFKLKLANSQKEKEGALQELASKRELEIQTIEQLSAALDKASADIKARDSDMETLKEKLGEAENQGEQKDLRWQEALLEMQNLKFELEKRDQEKVELDTRLQSSVGQQEFDKSITDRNKLIASLKKKLKEERAGKKEEIATLQSSLTEKDQEVQRLTASYTEELYDVTSRLQASEEDNRRSEEKALAVERELNDAKEEVKNLTKKMEKIKKELQENQERFQKEVEEQELDFTSSMEALNSQKDESDKLIEELRREVKELNERIDRFAEDKCMEQHEKQLLVDEIERLSEAVELSKTKDEDITSLEHELEELQREKRAVEDQLGLVQGEIIQLREENQQLQIRAEVAKVESTSPLMGAPPDVGDAGFSGETVPAVVSATALPLECPPGDIVFDPAGSDELAKVKRELSDVQAEVTRVKVLNDKLKAKLRTLSKKEKAKSESGGVDDLSELRAEVEKARQDKINVEKTAHQLREELDIVIRRKDGLIGDLKANVHQLLDEKTRNETLLKKYEAIVLEKDNDIQFLKNKSLEEVKTIRDSYDVLCEEKDTHIKKLESTLQQEKLDYVDELEITKDGYESILNKNEAVIASLQRDLDSAAKEIAQLQNRLQDANQSLEEVNKLKSDFDHIVSGLRDDLRQALDDKAASDEIAHEFQVQLKEQERSGDRSRVRDVATGTSEADRIGSVGQHEDAQEERQRLEETVEAMFKEREVLQERIAWLETLVEKREGTRVEHEAADGRELEEFQAQGDDSGGELKVQTPDNAEEPNDVLWLQTELKKTSVLNEKLKSKLRAVLKEKRRAKSDPREDDTSEDIRAELERVRAAKLNREKTIQELRVEVDSFVKDKERIVGDLRSKMDQVLREKERCSSLVEHNEKLLLEKESVIHELTEQLQSVRDDNERLTQNTEELKTASSKLQSSVQLAIDQKVEIEREKFKQRYEPLLEENNQKIWELQAEMEGTKEEYRKEISDIKEQYGDILSRKQREADQALAELQENNVQLLNSLRAVSEERDVIEKQLSETKSELELVVEGSYPVLEEKDRQIDELNNILVEKQRNADEIVTQLLENETQMQKEITELGERCQESDKRLQEAELVLAEKKELIETLEKDLQTRGERYEEHVLLSRLKEDKLEEDLAEARVQSEYLSNELLAARQGWQDINKLKSNFDNIVSGLREDLQRVLSDKAEADNVAHEFQVELERMKRNLPGESRSGAAVGVSQQENKIEEMNIRLAEALNEAAELKASLGKVLQEKVSLQDKVKGLEVLLQEGNKSERELIADSSHLKDSKNVKKDEGEMKMENVSQEVILQSPVTNELLECEPGKTSEADVEIQNLKNEMQKMKATNERLKSKLWTAAKKKLVKSESGDEDVSDELKAQLEKARQEKLDSEKTLQELRVELDAVVRQKERIVSDLKAKIEKLVEATEKSNNVLDQCKQQIAQKDTDIQELKENVLNLEREKIEVDRLLRDLEQQKGDLRVQVQDVSSQRAMIEEQLEHVKLEHETLLQDHLGSVKDKDNTISGLETRLQDTKEQYETEIEATRSQYEEIVFQIQSHADKLERNLQLANEQTERLNVDLSDMKREREDINNLKTNFDHIVSGLRGDLQRALEEKATADAIASEFQVELKRLQSSPARRDEEYKDSADDSTEGEITEEMKEKLKSVLKEAEDLKASLERANRDKRDLEEKLATVEVEEHRGESLTKTDKDLNDLPEQRISSEVLLQSPDDKGGLVERVANATLTSHSPVDISVGTIDFEELQKLKVEMSQLQSELDKVKNVNERLRAKLKAVVRKTKEAKSDAGDEASIDSLRAELKKTHQEKLDSEKAAQDLRVELDGIFRQKEKIVSDLKVRIEELLWEKEQNSSLVEKYEKLLLERDAELSRLDKQFQCLSETQEECSRNLAEHQAENLSIKEQLGQVQELKDAAERDLQHATVELERLIQDQQSHLEEKDQRISELESERVSQKDWYGKQMQAMKDQFESVLFEQQNHSTNLEQALIGANKDVKRLKSELQEIREAAVDVHQLRSNFDHIVLGLRQDLQQALEEKTAAEEMAQEFKMKLKRIRKSPEGSKTELRDVGSDTKDIQTEFVAANHKEIEKLQNAMGPVQEEKEELKGKRMILDAVVHDKEADVEEKDRQIQELQLEMQRLTAEHANAADRFSNEINRVTNESKGERDRLDALLIEKAETCDKLKEELHYLKEENFSLTETFGREKGQLEAELGEKRQIVDKLNEELSHLRSGKNKSDEEKLHEELQANYEALETGNSKLRQDLYMTLKEKENLRAKLKKDYEQILASLNIELEQSREQNLEKEKLNHILRTEVESLVMEKSLLGEKLRENLGVTKERLLKASEGQKGVEEVLGELKNEINWLRKECQDCKTEKDQLYTKFRTVTESLRKELEKSLREKDELSQKIDDTLNQNRSLQQSLIEKQSTLTKAKLQFEHIGKGWRSDLEAARAEKEEALKQLRERWENQTVAIDMPQDEEDSAETLEQLRNRLKELEELYEAKCREGKVSLQIEEVGSPSKESIGRYHLSSPVVRREASSFIGQVSRLCRRGSSLSVGRPRGFRKAAVAMYFVALHLLAFMYLFQILF